MEENEIRTIPDLASLRPREGENDEAAESHDLFTQWDRLRRWLEGSHHDAAWKVNVAVLRWIARVWSECAPLVRLITWNREDREYVSEAVPGEVAAYIDVFARGLLFALYDLARGTLLPLVPKTSRALDDEREPAPGADPSLDLEDKVRYALEDYLPMLAYLATDPRVSEAGRDAFRRAHAALENQDDEVLAFGNAAYLLTDPAHALHARAAHVRETIEEFLTIVDPGAPAPPPAWLPQVRTALAAIRTIVPHYGITDLAEGDLSRLATVARVRIAPEPWSITPAACWPGDQGELIVRFRPGLTPRQRTYALLLYVLHRIGGRSLAPSANLPHAVLALYGVFHDDLLARGADAQVDAVKEINPAEVYPGAHALSEVMEGLDAFLASAGTGGEEQAIPYITPPARDVPGAPPAEVPAVSPVGIPAAAAARGACRSIAAVALQSLDTVIPLARRLAAKGEGPGSPRSAGLHMMAVEALTLVRNHLAAARPDEMDVTADLLRRAEAMLGELASAGGHAVPDEVAIAWGLIPAEEGGAAHPLSERMEALIEGDEETETIVHPEAERRCTAAGPSVESEPEQSGAVDAGLAAGAARRRPRAQTLEALVTAKALHTGERGPFSLAREMAAVVEEAREAFETVYVLAASEEPSGAAPGLDDRTANGVLVEIRKLLAMAASEAYDTAAGGNVPDLVSQEMARAEAGLLFVHVLVECVAQPELEEALHDCMRAWGLFHGTGPRPSARIAALADAAAEGPPAASDLAHLADVTRILVTLEKSVAEMETAARAYPEGDGPGKTHSHVLAVIESLAGFVDIATEYARMDEKAEVGRMVLAGVSALNYLRALNMVEADVLAAIDRTRAAWEAARAWVG